MNVLALDYRPFRFSDVVGQAHVKPVLRKMVETNRLPAALLFSGTRGTGKTTCARILAAALNCPEGDCGDSCGECPCCLAVQNGNFSPVIEVDAASAGGVDEIRRIQEMCLTAHDGNWRVIILDEAHAMSTQAYNALLKMLEEPPAQTLFVLVTTEPEKILGTVRSRAMAFEFRRIRTDEVVSRLTTIAEQEGLPYETGLFLEIAKVAQGGLRDAVMLFDQVSRVGVMDANGFRSFFGVQDYSLPLMWSALRGDHAEGYRLVGEHFARTGEASGLVSDLSRLVSELLVIKSEGRPHDYGEEALAERVEMAKAADTANLVRVIEVLWDLRNRVRATENDQRSSMEMAFALIANAVRPQGPVVTATPILATESTQRLSLAEIAAFAEGA